MTGHSSPLRRKGVRTVNERFRSWLMGEKDIMGDILTSADQPDLSYDERKEITRQAETEFESRPEVLAAVERDRRRFRKWYIAIAIISSIGLFAILMYAVLLLPQYGAENINTVGVVRRYVEKGLEETGAVNIVAGLILDYRAFDTLGESHVLFTALVCVMVLLRIDQKNMRTDFEDYYTVRKDTYFDLSKDMIIRMIGLVLIPCILLFGIYVLLNGQNGPGGGFSGGAVIGAALILSSLAFGFETVDRVFTRRVMNVITFVSLGFYSFAKGYVFFMGANGLENHIPKGIPGAIFSGGLILPLDIAVGCVVGCTMFGFFSLFRRGSIGG